MGGAEASLNGGATCCCVCSVLHEENREHAMSIAYAMSFLYSSLLHKTMHATSLLLYCQSYPALQKHSPSIPKWPEKCHTKIKCCDLTSLLNDLFPDPWKAIYTEGSWSFFFLLILLGWVVQKLYFSSKKIERIFLSIAQHFLITERGNVGVSVCGTSIWEVVSLFSEMLLWQFQVLLGLTNKEQNPYSKEGL